MRTLLVAAFAAVAAHAWQRTKCGPGDQVTTWGAAVDPSNVLPEYPRPQMTRDASSTYKNMNGIWQWQAAGGFSDPIPFGQTLNGTILVPFPTEACLSGVGETHKYMYYRTVFDAPFPGATGRTLLHFGAVDWNSTVYLNGQSLGSHVGGYDGFSFDTTPLLKTTGNELIVFVHDPSDDGAQPNGKQRISAIPNPGGDTYTPSSGIWQTVWAESVPSLFIERLKIITDTSKLTLTVYTNPNLPGSVNVTVYGAGGGVVATGTGSTYEPIVVPIPNPQTWSTQNPFLYNMSVTVVEPSTSITDTVGSYFGLRTVGLAQYQMPAIPPTGPQVGVDRPGNDLPGYPVVLNTNDYNQCWALCNKTAACTAWAASLSGSGNGCSDGKTIQCWLKSGHPGAQTGQDCRVSGDQGGSAGTGSRPVINGNYTFLAGWLDQSWWPDGEYTAPSDAALAFDVQSVKQFGLNFIRLHQKVNSDRWYYYADTLGVAVQQDMIQKYGGASAATVPFYMSDLKAMLDGRGNHPSIIQWTAFNEGDCWNVFDVPSVVSWIKEYDPTRLVDTDSGGGANGLGIGDVNDAHNYPYPGDPTPSATQYAEQGEFGGIGAFITGHEWVPGQCSTYLKVDTPQEEADTYVTMAQQLLNRSTHVSASVYTQITDVERECDGFLNMDRTNKFNAAQMAEIIAANQALIASGTAIGRAAMLPRQ